MSTIIVRPKKVQPGKDTLQTLYLDDASASWTGATTFAISGVSGVTLVTQIVDSAHVARLGVKTAGASLHGTGTLTVSDGTNSGTTSITPIAPTRRRWYPGLARSS